MRKHPNLTALLIYTFLTLFLTWPLLANITTHYPSTYYEHGGDPNMYIWFMDTMAKKFAGQDINAGKMIFYPEGVNLWASYEAPIILAVSTPVILLTGNPILAYNIIFLLAFILTCYTCYLLILYLTNSYYSALITGLSFGFSEYMLVRGTQHLDLLFLFSVLWAVLCAFKFVNNPDKKNTIYLVLSIFITALCAWYYALGLLMFLGIFFLFNFSKFLAAKKQYFIAAIASGLLLGFFSLPMLLNKTDASYEYVNFLINDRGADALNFFIPHPYVHSWSWLFYTGFSSPYEATSYYGLVGLVAIAVMLFLRKKIQIPYLGFWMLVTLIFMLLALGNQIKLSNWSIPMPFSFLNNFPPFDRLRAPNRFFIFSYLAVSVLFGYFLAYARTLFKNSQQLVAFSTIVILLLALERFFWPYPILSLPVPEFYRNIGQSAEKYAIADIPIINPGFSIYNYYQIYHKKPIVDGEYFWTAYTSQTFDFIKSNQLLANSLPCDQSIVQQKIDRPKTLKHLFDNNIRYVVMHNFLLQDVKCPEVGLYVRNFFHGQKPVFSDGEITVYATNPTP